MCVVCDPSLCTTIGYATAPAVLHWSTCVPILLIWEYFESHISTYPYECLVCNYDMSKSWFLSPQPWTLSRELWALSPEPWAPSPEPWVHPEPRALNLKTKWKNWAQSVTFVKKHKMSFCLCYPNFTKTHWTWSPKFEKVNIYIYICVIVITTTEPRALILKSIYFFLVNYKYENTGSGLRAQGSG